MSSGTRVAIFTHRAPSVPPSAGSASSRRAAREVGPGRSRSPASAISAGSTVSATSTATHTAPAAATPITDRNGMPTTDNPHRAMTTVVPAKTTAVPAVATARAADSSTAMPSASWCRCRDRMNSA